MKFEFKKGYVSFITLKEGDLFSSLEEPRKLFMKISAIHDPGIGLVNSVDVSDGHPSYFASGGRIIPRKETVIVE